MEPDAEPNLEQLENSPTNPRSSKYILYVITRSVIATTITDISLSAELVCSTKRVRRRSRKFKERVKWHIRSSSKFSPFSALAIPWRLVHLLLSLDYYKTLLPILNSMIFLPHSAGSVSFFFYFSLFLDNSTNEYNIYNEYNEEKGKQFHAVKMQNGKKQRVQQLSMTKHTITVMAFLLERMAQFFYLAHFSVFYLGDVQRPRQKQNWDQKPQCVFGKRQKDLKLETDAVI